MEIIKFKLYRKGIIQGFEKLTKSGWEWFAYDVHTKDYQRGVFPYGHMYDRVQFTGIKDKYDNDIYQGDIILDSFNEKWEVQYKDGCFWLYRPTFNTCNVMRSWPDNSYPMFRVDHSKFSEVIGNIHKK